jgi:hypothetical protein
LEKNVDGRNTFGGQPDCTPWKPTHSSLSFLLSPSLGDAKQEGSTQNKTKQKTKTEIER